MSVPLPQPLPTVGGWRLSDWIDQSYTSGPASGGIARIELPQLDYATRWQLTHMVIGCTSTQATALRLYFGSVSNGNLRDGSSAGNFDVADWNPGLMVPPSSVLIAQWTGCTDGAQATLTLQANVYRQAS